MPTPTHYHTDNDPSSYPQGLNGWSDASKNVVDEIFINLNIILFLIYTTEMGIKIKYTCTGAPSV